MDWKQILSLSKEELSDERQEEIYTELVKDQKFDGKIAKKLFPLCLSVLKFKGGQVDKQKEQIELLASSDIDLKSTLELVEKQKKLILKYETEKGQFKARIKELSEELSMIQSTSRGDGQGSDEDSPDQMSEIDRQQDLLSNISMKNKHIKRLLKDIEILEGRNTSQLKLIEQLKSDIEASNENYEKQKSQFTENESTIKFLEGKISNLNIEIKEKDSENQQLIQARKSLEEQIEEFSKQVDQRIQMFKGILAEKENDLELAQRKYENLIEQFPAGFDVDSEQSEIRRLMTSLHDSEELIKTFEKKISLLSAELLDATELIRKLTKERDEFQSRLTREKTDKCCDEIQIMLERSNERCQELQEILENVENDNVLKAKQAFEAIETLKSYENSTDGLADALKKIHNLQEQCHQKDSQIHELVIELNAQTEIAAENSILRQKCGIPDDEIIETKAFLAKQKRYSKINERLTLKLRASEEMRLQLKIEKNDLRRRIAQLEMHSGKRNESISSYENNLNICESCSNTFNMEMEKLCRNCRKQNNNICENCVSRFKTSNEENIEMIKKIAKLEIEHRAVVDENENLRIGLNEILEKLRDHESSSNHQTIINPATLEKLIAILRLRNNVNIIQNVEKIGSPSNESAAISETIENEKLKEIIQTLSEKNDEISTKLEQMEMIEKNYEELVRSSELSDDEKHQLLMKSLKRCHEFENNCIIFERKIEFLKNENDFLSKELKIVRVTAIATIHDLRMELFEKSHELDRNDEIISEEIENLSEIDDLKNELQVLKTQLSNFCIDVLKDAKSFEGERKQLFEMKVDVIENNLSASIITQSELNSMKRKISSLELTVKKHESKENQLDELVRVLNSQLKSQQLLLTQFSDDEISSRHLIVDLQSKSNENYLLTKTTKELQLSKVQCDEMKLENEKIREEIESLHKKLTKSSEEYKVRENELQEKQSQNQLKLEYLQKTLLRFCNEYSSLTPLYLIVDFVKDYSNVIEMRHKLEEEKIKFHSQSSPTITPEIILEHLKRDTMTNQKITDIEARIEIIKQKSSCEYLKQQLELRELTIRDLHDEVARIKMNEIKNVQHWNAIKMLFDKVEVKETIEKSDNSTQILTSDKSTQATVTMKSFGINTEPTSSPESSVATIVEVPKTQPIIQQIPIQQTRNVDEIDHEESLKSQLKKAIALAQSRSVALIDTENQLSEARGRIKALEKSMENREKQHQKEKDELLTQPPKSPKKDENVTISTLQSMLLEKDTILSKYQELLKTERQQHTKSSDELCDEIKNLKKLIDSHELQVIEKEKQIEKLKKKIEEMHEKLEAPKSKPTSPVKHVTFEEQETKIKTLDLQYHDAQNQIKQMEQEIRDLTNLKHQIHSTLHDKEKVIKDLSSKLNSSSSHFVKNSVTTEIDQLREMLEEKDRHIQDLTETLQQFHDDQQKYINDSAINSAEQVHMISSDLNRADAENRVLKTQLEAVKRQLENVLSREKATREMNKTLKNQLIRRPVIAIKNNKRPATAGEQNYQTRIRELENELVETKDELRRQANINDNKRVKNTTELWSKQKRYQEMSEKLKQKLTESEIECERLKANLQMAKNTALKFEKEKNMLEHRLKSDRHRQNFAIAQKTTTTCLQCQNQKQSSIDSGSDFGSDMNNEIINTLKARIASQQRKIISYEFDGKGSNAMSLEIEKLHEQLSAVESQNMRLEAKNTQLQVELDMMRQTDSSDKQASRIKHLEEYILVLKDEISVAHSKSCDINDKHCKHDHSKINEMQQTILSLKRLVERLKSENKHLKDSKSSVSSSVLPSSSSSTIHNKKDESFEKLKSDYEKLKKMNNELVTRTSALEVELQLTQSQSITYSCPHCNKNLGEMASQDADVLSQQLLHKNQLLEKAKSLLTRSAAKEKQLRSQIEFLKKRISQLEGVPIISEENSESSQL